MYLFNINIILFLYNYRRKAKMYKQKQNSQTINKLDKEYLKVMQNIKSRKFVSLKSAADIDKYIERLKGEK